MQDKVRKIVWYKLEGEFEVLNIKYHPRLGCLITWQVRAL